MNKDIKPEYVKNINNQNYQNNIYPLAEQI